MLRIQSLRFLFLLAFRSNSFSPFLLFHSNNYFEWLSAKDEDLVEAMVICTLIQTGCVKILPAGCTSRASLMREIRLALIAAGYDVPPHVNRVYADRLMVPIWYSAAAAA